MEELLYCAECDDETVHDVVDGLDEIVGYICEECGRFVDFVEVQ